MTRTDVAAGAWPAELPILLRRPDCVVIDKPAGLPVHAGPRAVHSVEDHFPQLSRRRDGPWLAHRLDADTAGCLVIALRRAALHAMQAEFAAGRARKTYWAVVQGAPPAPAGTTQMRLRKQTTTAGWRMEAAEDGDGASTSWRVLGSAQGLSWLELHPHTGRTHQIRVHCAHLGCPLLGDPVYGKGEGRLQLLARAIEIDLADPIRAVAGVPAHMHGALQALGWRASQEAG